MKKIFMGLIVSASLVFGAGCILTQPKTINVGYTAYNEQLKTNIDEKFTNVKYLPILLEGKSFKELFVGSKIIIDTTSSKLTIPNMEAKIIDIKADKRIKGKPRTGTVKLLVMMNKKTSTIPMKYNYNNGYFTAEGMLKLKEFNIHNKTLSNVKISFNTIIQAILCDVKVKK